MFEGVLTMSIKSLKYTYEEVQYQQSSMLPACNFTKMIFLQVLLKDLAVNFKKLFYQNTSLWLLPNLSFMLFKKSYEKSYVCLHYIFLTFFDTERESDKSYVINHIVYFALNAMIMIFPTNIHHHCNFSGGYRGSQVPHLRYLNILPHSFFSNLLFDSHR